MPQFFTIIIADANGTVSPAVVAALGGPELRGVAPYLLPAYTLHVDGHSHALAHLTATRGLIIMPAINVDVIDPRKVDLWLVVDRAAEAVVRRRVCDAGPPSDSFYRGPFPDPVVWCGFTIPNYSFDRAGVDTWYDQLTDLFAPWHKRIMRAFFDSS
jgi:hypothetical protein